MKYRLLIVSVVIAGLAAHRGSVCGADKSIERPNVLFIAIDDLIDREALKTLRHKAGRTMCRDKERLPILKRVDTIRNGQTIVARNSNPAHEWQAVGDTIMSPLDPDVLIGPAVMITTVMNEAAAMIAVFIRDVHHTVPDDAKTVEPCGIDPRIAGL